MGREVRRVPATWQHPKNESGRYIPLHGDSYSKRAAEWDIGAAKWTEGLKSDHRGGWVPLRPEQNYTYSEWDGERPIESDYMPDWPEAERTHWQMYEDTSEGTPISPVMASPEELATWLADNGASAFAGMPASREHWLKMIVGRGYAPCAIRIGDGPIMSGVEALGK